MYREPRYHPLRVSHSINVQLRWGTKIQILVHYIWYIYTHNLPSGWAVKVVHSRANIYHVKKNKHLRIKNLDFLLYFLKFRHWQLSDFWQRANIASQETKPVVSAIFLYSSWAILFFFVLVLNYSRQRVVNQVMLTTSLRSHRWNGRTRAIDQLFDPTFLRGL